MCIRFWDFCGIFAGDFKVREGPRLQFAGNLFESCNSNLRLWPDIFLDELPTDMPIGGPVAAATCPGFLPGCEMSAIPGLECERWNLL